jgi:hypothetical protein
VAAVPPPEPPAAEPAQRRVRSKPAGAGWKRPKVIIPAILLILLLAWLTHGYITTKNQLEAAKNGQGSSPSLQVQQKVALIAAVPAGETPTVATVNNADKLRSTAFFKDAQNGDKVLFYPSSGLAILYRPSSNKIIRYQPASLENTSTNSASNPAATTSPANTNK